MINYEGGAIPEEYQVEYVADRVDTTSNVFMGLTMGCARCHDHKYDPISQKDYYRFFAFFNTIAEKGLDGKHRQRRAHPRNAHRRAGKRSGLAAAVHRRARSRAPGKRNPTAARRLGQDAPRHPPRAAARRPPRRSYAFDGNLTDSSRNHRDGKTVKGTTTFVAGRPGQSAAFNGEAHIEFPTFQSDRFAVALLDAQRSHAPK